MRLFRLPAGLVREGKVDRLWLERFARQAEEKAEPLWNPSATIRQGSPPLLEPVEEGHYILACQRDTGTTGAPGRGQGAGGRSRAHGRFLQETCDRISAASEDVLLQQKYIEQRARSKPKHRNWGTWMPISPLMRFVLRGHLPGPRIELVLQTGNNTASMECGLRGSLLIPTVPAAVPGVQNRGSLLFCQTRRNPAEFYELRTV